MTRTDLVVRAGLALVEQAHEKRDALLRAAAAVAAVRNSSGAGRSGSGGMKGRNG